MKLFLKIIFIDLTVGLVNVATDIAWKTTVGFYAGNITCKVVKFSQVSYHSFDYSTILINKS